MAMVASGTTFGRLKSTNAAALPMSDATLKLPTAPREVIEHIRRYEFGIGASLDAEGRVVVANMQRRYQSLLETVAEDLNSKESHFILELVQNADDNKYSDGVDASLSFSAESSRLVIVNNEAGFLPENVAALCSAGESSKKNKTGYIGEKGIGFKSVFKVTDAPEIHSNGYHFRFNRSDPKDLLGYVVPHWKDPDFPVDGHATTLVLPARPGKPFPLNLLKDLDATLLLFLEKLRRLEVKTKSEVVVYVRKDIGPVTTLTTHHSPPDGARQHPARSYFRTSAKYDFSSIKEPKRVGISETDLVLAFPLSDAGEAEPDPNSPIYAFLPIRDFGFPFCIQADFVLISSREGIHEDLEWNITLRDEIAPSFIEALEKFKAKPRLANTYLRFLPEAGAVHDPFFKPVVDQLVSELKEAECVRVEGGKWRKPQQVLLASQEAHALFSSSDALKLFGAEYPSAAFDASPEQLKRIGCKSLTMPAVVNIFTEHSSWLSDKPLEWKARFYAYLALPSRRSEYTKALKEVACLPTADGRLVSPKAGTIFFPLSKKGKAKYGFEHELTVLDDEFYDAALAESPEVKSLFEGLGVKPDNPYTLIRDHILKRHGVQELGNDHKALIGHLRYVRDKLEPYLLHAAALGQTRQTALQALKEGVSVGTNQVEGDWLFNSPSQLYLSRAYRPVFDIDSMLGDKIEPALLVSDAYVHKKRGASPEDIVLELESWRRFFYDIGVNESPLLTIYGGQAACSAELKALLVSPDSTVRRATLECLDRNWHKYEGHLTYSFRSGRQNYENPTLFKSELQATRAPTKRKSSVPLPQAYLNDPNIKTVLGGNAVFVEADLHNHRFLDAAGITYKVDATACLKRLGQIRDSKGGATRDQVRAIYRQLESLWHSERATIEAAFALQPLIMVGAGESTCWVLPKDACWQPTHVQFLDAQHAPLQSQYFEHRTFFTRQLSVPLELSLSKWVDALAALSDVEDADERKSVALTIYRRLHRELGPQLKGAPDWLQRFANEPLFLDHRGTLVRKSDSLFANDDSEYAQLFEGVESISLLSVHHDHLSGIANLLRATGIPRVSTSVSVEPAGNVAGEVSQVLTQKVRDLFGCIARVVYSQSHERFEIAVKEQLFEHLRALEVQVVPELELDVTLGGVTKTTSGDAAPRDRQLLVRANAPLHVDHVAMEVRRILRLPQTQVATMSVLLRSMNLKDAEDYLRVTHVSQLPSDEQAMLDGIDSNRTTDADSEPIETVRPDPPGAAASEDDAQQQAPDEGEPPSSGESTMVTDSAGRTQDTGPTAAHGLGATRKHGYGVDGARHQPTPDGTTAPAPTSLPGSSTTTTPSTARPHVQREGQDATDQSLTGTRATGIPPAAHGAAGAHAGTDRWHGNNINEAAVPSPVANAGDGRGTFLNGADSIADGYAPSEPSRSSTGPGTGAGDGSSRRRQAAGTKRPLERTNSGRLLSYPEPLKGSSAPRDEEDESNPEVLQRRMAIETAAVDYFLAMASNQWRDVKVVPNPNNPGFDIQAIAHDGAAEFIEVKGQSGAWTETGVAVSPTQLRKAEEQRERFWLCVVEYATDETRRQLYLVNNPFGRTDQFRFDMGWKGVATVIAAKPTHPRVGLFVTLIGEGKARIFGVKGKGRLVKIDYQFIANGQKRFSKLFQPNTMTLSVD
jgi:hypothetical protein